MGGFCARWGKLWQGALSLQTLLITKGTPQLSVFNHVLRLVNEGIPRGLCK